MKKRGNKKNYEGYNKYRSNQYIRNNNQVIDHKVVLNTFGIKIKLTGI